MAFIDAVLPSKWNKYVPNQVGVEVPEFLGEGGAGGDAGGDDDEDWG